MINTDVFNTKWRSAFCIAIVGSLAVPQKRGGDIEMDSSCFIIQPYDKGGKFDKRYKDTIKPTIAECGYIPYRVDEDYGATIPIEAIESGLKQSHIVVAEITTNNPNVWFELGFALALNKPIVLLCSDERKGKTPFDVRHRTILRYRTGSSSDFDELRQQLKLSLRARCDGATLQEIQGNQSEAITETEWLVLKRVSELQSTPYSVTSTDMLGEIAPPEKMRESFRMLQNKGMLQLYINEPTNEKLFQLTKKGEHTLAERKV